MLLLTLLDRPDSIPLDVWQEMNGRARSWVVKWMTEREKQAREQDEEREEEKQRFEQQKSELERRKERQAEMEILLTKYRNHFMDKCPQRLSDLKETDVVKFTPFSTKQHMILWYKHYVMAETTWNGKRVPRVTTIEGYAGHLERYRIARREGEEKSAPKFANGTIQWTYGMPALDAHGEPRFPDDKAGGVGILLSDRACAKYMSHGSPCSRICWVRVRGPTTNLFVVAVYMPHRARINPDQKDTIEELMKLLRQVPTHDCLIVLGDFNEQLPAGVEHCTGKWNQVLHQRTRIIYWR